MTELEQRVADARKKARLDITASFYAYSTTEKFDAGIEALVSLERAEAVWGERIIGHTTTTVGGKDAEADLRTACTAILGKQEEAEAYYETDLSL